VNLSALRENLNHYRNFLKPETKVICMVKASAYGVGAMEVARTLQDCHVNYLAVAVVDEAWSCARPVSLRAS
jgi:alanine racemase